MFFFIHNKNFIYFLHEAQYRSNISELNTIQKLDDFAKVLSSVEYDKFQSEEDLLNLDYDVCFDD